MVAGVAPNSVEIFHKILNRTYESEAERDQALLAIFDEYLQVGVDNTMELAKTEKAKTHSRLISAV